MKENTKKPLSKNLIKQSLSEFFKQDEEKVETVMEHMVSKQEVVKSYKLLRSTKIKDIIYIIYNNEDIFLYYSLVGLICITADM